MHTLLSSNHSPSIRRCHNVTRALTKTMPLILAGFLTLAVLGVALPILRFMLSTLRPRNYPPGPRPCIGLGNLHQLPPSRSFLAFSAWTSTYGPVIGLKIGSINLVVLNRARHVRQLMQEQSAALSARPRLPIPSKYIFPSDENHPLWSDSEHHQRMRRALIHHTSPSGIADAAPVIRALVARLTYSLLEGKDFNRPFHTWAYDIALALLFGRTTEDAGQDWMDDYLGTQRRFVTLIEPGIAQLAGIFPVLGWLPERYASWKRDANLVRDRFNTTWGTLVRLVKQETSGSKKGERGAGGYESVVTRLYRENLAKTGETIFPDREIELIAGATLDAISGTMLSTALFLVQALAANPSIQRRAQAEVDEVWTREGIPTGIDVGKMPFISACVTEILRWRPPLPLSVPRMCLSDQLVDNYRIPAGSTIAPNVWAIHHDPEEYDRPDEFDPDRFIRNPNGTKRVPEETSGPKKPLYVFGLGRRACPGDQLALMELRVMAAFLLWSFDIVAEEEMDCSPETGILEGITVTPKPFRVRFIPRDGAVQKVVLEEWNKGNQFIADRLH